MAEELQQKPGNSGTEVFPPAPPEETFMIEMVVSLPEAPRWRQLLVIPPQIEDPYFTAKALFRIGNERGTHTGTDHQERAAVYVKRKLKKKRPGK